MSIGYTWEKLYGAVRALACGDGPLPDRLAQAYQAIHMLTRDDFPDAAGGPDGRFYRRTTGAERVNGKTIGMWESK